MKVAKRKSKKNIDKNTYWTSINIYITNISAETIDKKQLHNIYALRWQVELMFTIWKSIFKIHDVKKVKLERFQCFLYARLIALLLTSSIVSTGKRITHEEKRKEISEIKSFAIVKEFFSEIRGKIFKGELVLFNFLNKIMNRILRYGRKSPKKGMKSTYSIIENVRIYESELVDIAI
ncbi:transposase [Clostridium bowmanii]|uniref:transposase n=1 Tax=Clostridium bowmanii TaxID=132925 RepID=UPI001CD6E5D0|nr:transposase [Clostridium bowmanii]MCA1073475.1 transposase [Clostridium bowmanii]